MPAKLTAATRNKQVETVFCYTIYIMLTRPYKNYDRPLKDGHRRLLFSIPPFPLITIRARDCLSILISLSRQRQPDCLHSLRPGLQSHDCGFPVTEKITEIFHWERQPEPLLII